MLTETGGRVVGVEGGRLVDVEDGRLVIGGGEVEGGRLVIGGGGVEGGRLVVVQGGLVNLGGGRLVEVEVEDGRLVAAGVAGDGDGGGRRLVWLLSGTSLYSLVV